MMQDGMKEDEVQNNSSGEDELGEGIQIRRKVRG